MEKDAGKFQEHDYLIKVVLIGDAAVGKSSLLLQYIDGTFEDTYVCTIGVDFKMKSLQIENKRIKLQVWDTAGQERFKPITKCYFRGSHGCVVLFDITNRISFNNIRSWITDYRENNTVDSAENIVIIGNKADKQAERKVTLEEAQNMAESLGARYIETSAKSGEGVAEGFETIARVVIKKPKELSLASKPLQSEKSRRLCCFR